MPKLKRPPTVVRGSPDPAPKPKREQVAVERRSPDPARKPKREDVPAGEVLCNHCTAKCCRYFALPLDEPTTWKDYDTMRWFLAHQDVSIFVDDGTWYLMLHNECRHLTADNQCGIYATRPQICRDYHTDNCEYDDEYVYEKIFENDAQLFEYAEAVLGPQAIPAVPVNGALAVFTGSSVK